MKENLEILHTVLVKLKLSEPVPHIIQKRMLSSKKRILVKILKAKGSYNFVFGATLSIFFAAKQIGLGLTVAQSAVALAAASLVMASSVIAGSYTAVKKIIIPQQKNSTSTLIKEPIIAHNQDNDKLNLALPTNKNSANQNQLYSVNTPLKSPAIKDNSNLHVHQQNNIVTKSNSGSDKQPVKTEKHQAKPGTPREKTAHQISTVKGKQVANNKQDRTIMKDATKAIVKKKPSLDTKDIIDATTKIGNNKNIIASNNASKDRQWKFHIGFNGAYHAPVGFLATFTDSAYGYGLLLGIENCIFNHFLFGIKMEYIKFNFNDKLLSVGSDPNRVVRPIILSMSYRFMLYHNFFIAPAFEGGPLGAWVLEPGLQFGYVLGRWFTFHLGIGTTTIIYKGDYLTSVSLKLGAGFSF